MLDIIVIYLYVWYMKIVLYFISIRHLVLKKSVRNFCRLLTGFWVPARVIKTFSKYYHFCHFVYIKCAIIMHLNTELYHHRKNRKKIE